MVLPRLLLLQRHSVSDPVRQLRLLLLPTHSEVNLLNPVLSASAQVLHPPLLLLLILSAPLNLLRLPLPLRLGDSASTLADPTMPQVHRLVSVTLHLLLLPPSVSVSPMPRLRPPLPLLDSHLAELVMVLRHLLNLHSALGTLHLLRMEVRPPLVSLKGSDLEVLPLEPLHLRTVDLVWVWMEVTLLEVLVGGKSSLLGGVRSVSKVSRRGALRSREE